VRTRIIRHEYFRDVRTDGLSIGARLTFVGIWCMADLRGVFRPYAADVAANVYPNDMATTVLEIEGFLTELRKADFIRSFTERGVNWGYIVDWLDWHAIGIQEVISGSSRPTPPGWIEPTNWARWIEKNERRGGQNEWRQLRLLVLRRDNYTCTYCGSQREPLHCDHIIPVARNGITELSNLTTACAACNISKGAKLVSEWRSHG